VAPRHAPRTRTAPGRGADPGPHRTIEDALERWDREALEARDRGLERDGQDAAAVSLRTPSGPFRRDRRHDWLGQDLAAVDPDRDPGPQ
jgi:hypothetical protein